MLVCLGLAVSGAALAQREYALAHAAAGFESEVFGRMIDAPLPVPGSISGSSALAERCIEITEGLYGALQPREMTATARKHCLGFAERTVARMPTHGMAHFLMAQALFAQAQDQSANAALSRSYAVAAHEQWLAEARVDVAEEHFDRLSPAARDGHLADLELLVLSNRGVRSMAYRYVSDPAFRERITAIVETLPNEEQARFVSVVRRAANDYGFAGLSQ